MKAKSKQKRAKKVAKKVAKVNYGRRVRNVRVDGELVVVPVRHLKGPHPVKYPELEWTPLAWRVTP